MKYRLRYFMKNSITDSEPLLVVVMTIPVHLDNYPISGYLLRKLIYLIQQVRLNLTSL